MASSALRIASMLSVGAGIAAVGWKVNSERNEGSLYNANTSSSTSSISLSNNADLKLPAFFAEAAKPANQPILMPPSPPSAQRPAGQNVPSGVPLNPVQQLQQLDKEGILRYGFPSATNVRLHEGYAVSFDFRTRNAHWACEHITNSMTPKSEKRGDRAHSTFKEDESVPPMFRPKLSDYQGSGFDRGHLVPAADLKSSQKAMNDSFYLTNVSPQVGNGFNRDYWARLEEFCRRLARENKDVFVCTGPLYLPKKEADGKYYVRYQMIGEPPSTAVPTHFFKVILVEKENKTFSLGAFVVPNSPIPQDTPLEKFSAPVDMVERHSGLMFYNRVPRQLTTPLCATSSCALPPPNFFAKGKGDKKALPPPSEPTLALPPPSTADMAQIKQQINNFAKSGEKELRLPATLSSKDRKVAHDTANDLGLEHRTQGEGNNRFVVITKKN